MIGLCDMMTLFPGDSALPSVSTGSQGPVITSFRRTVILLGEVYIRPPPPRGLPPVTWPEDKGTNKNLTVLWRRMAWEEVGLVPGFFWGWSGVCLTDVIE